MMCGEAVVVVYGMPHLPLEPGCSLSVAGAQRLQCVGKRHWLVVLVLMVVVAVVAAVPLLGNSCWLG
jgi:hypothetical protein